MVRRIIPHLTVSILFLSSCASVALAQGFNTQSLSLQSGDNVTVSGSGTSGIYMGQPVPGTLATTSAYSQVSTVANSNFTLKDGGSLSGRSSYYPEIVSLGTCIINGGTITGFTGIVSKGITTISGGTLSSNFSDGHSVYENASLIGEGVTTINGGTISATSSFNLTSGFVAVAANEGTMTINGGMISASGNNVTALSVVPLLRQFFFDNVTINGGTISASGPGSVSVFATANDNSNVVSDPITINGGTLFVSGNNSAAIEVSDEGQIKVNGGSISAQGQNAVGLKCTGSFDAGVIILNGTGFNDGKGHPFINPITSGSGTIVGTLADGETINTTYSVQSGAIEFVTPSVTIITPSTGASPQSNYVALTGKGPANGAIEILVDGVPTLTTFQNTTANVDSDGDWEKVVYVGPGYHLLKAENVASSTNVSNTVIVQATPPTTLPQAITDYSLLRKADIFLTRGLNSPQIAIFYNFIPVTGFNYTHTALYLGGDVNGTPMVAEAVTASEGGAYGAVRDVPLELSTVWTDGTTVGIYRATAALNKSQKSAIVSFAQSVTNKGLPYWSFTSDFSLFLKAFFLWNNDFDSSPSPTLLASCLKQLDIKKNATDHFICSTLVWHAYYSGTNSMVDLSLPNNATPGATIGRLITPKFLHTLQPHFVFPDTLAQDGQLFKIN